MTGTWKNKANKYARLMEIIDAANTDACVPPPGHPHPTTGYGYVWLNGRSVDAHVVACTFTHGARPSPELEAAHSCGARFCVNPRHLRWATSQENQRDRDLHGTRCAQYGEDAARAKLTWASVAKIRELLETGLPQHAIAQQFGVSQMAISAINTGRTWRVGAPDGG